MVAWDGVVLAVLLVSMCVGAWRGLVFELLSLVGWVVAFFVARLITPEAALRLQDFGLTGPVAYGVGFVGLFIVLIFVWGLVTSLAKHVIDATGLRPVDRALGGCFGLLRAGVLLLVATVVVQSTSLVQAPWWTQSHTAPWLQSGVAMVLPTLTEVWGQLLPS